MTHLSVKTLRPGRQVGLLEPARVNPDTGYRSRTTGPIPTVPVIRRLRDLEMPVADVRAVLAAPGAAPRNALIAAHLDQLGTRLARILDHGSVSRSGPERPAISGHTRIRCHRMFPIGP